MKFLIDTHVHTAEVSPCCRLPAKEIVKLYKESGYDALFITDHFTEAIPVFQSRKSWQAKVDNYLRGYRIGAEEGEKEKLKVFLGVEVTLSSDPKRDFLLFGVDELFLYENENLYHRQLPEFYNTVSQAGGIVIQAHPLRKGGTIAPFESIDGIELYNGNPRHNSPLYEALKAIQSRSIIVTSGSDTHQKEDVGRGGMVLPHSVSEPHEVVTLLKNRSEEVKLLF